MFRVNTCLWGGVFNPIVPMIHRIPAWWSRDRFSIRSARQVVDGYLDFFEPDYLVEAEAGLGNGLGFAKDRVIQLGDVLSREGQRHPSGVGQDVFDLYRSLYRTEFQFARRDQHNIVDARPERVQDEALCACVFGGFPTDADRTYFAQAFQDAFDPVHETIRGDRWADLFKSGFTSALRIGREEIRPSYHDSNDPALFVMDGRDPRDLLDFWNLRAVYRSVVPIPLQWIKELAPFCREFISKNHRPLPDNPHGVMIRTTVMFGRAVSTDRIDEVRTEYFKIATPNSVVFQTWYPDLWTPSPEFVSRRMRPTLTAGERTQDFSLGEAENGLQLGTLYPEFSDEYGTEVRWANAVNLRDWSHRNTLAVISPDEYRNPQFPKLGLGIRPVLPTTEGYIHFPRFRNQSEYWRLPKGSTAIGEWLKTEGIEARLSDGGRTTEQVIQTLGGLLGVNSIANADVIHWMDKIARKGPPGSVPVDQFRNRINQASKGDLFGEERFGKLVDQNAVELGLNIKCSQCGSWCWYAIGDVAQNLTCLMCLREFRFPVKSPGSGAKWSYKPAGPFSLTGFAQGGYSAALAIRFFAEVLGHFDKADVTWSAGQDLKFPSAIEAEVDFILWFRRKKMFGNDYPTDLVFGEAKSFGKDAFQAKDVERMKELAVRFPGATIVFSTMKPGSELSGDEVQRITRLAQWGRVRSGSTHQMRAKVVLLTGAELFSPLDLGGTWKAIGGKHAAFSHPRYRELENLKLLADITQQLYLGLPSFDQELMDRVDKRRGNSGKRKS